MVCIHRIDIFNAIVQGRNAVREMSMWIERVVSRLFEVLKCISHLNHDERKTILQQEKAVCNDKSIQVQLSQYHYFTRANNAAIEWVCYKKVSNTIGITSYPNKQRCHSTCLITVLVLIKLTKYAVALRLRCGSCKLIFWHYFIIVCKI